MANHSVTSITPLENTMLTPDNSGRYNREMRISSNIFYYAGLIPKTELSTPCATASGSYQVHAQHQDHSQLRTPYTRRFKHPFYNGYR